MRRPKIGWTEFLGAALLLILVAGTASPGVPTAEAGPSRKGRENVEYVLYQLVNSGDRGEFAENRGLFYENGRVRVILELKDGGYGSEVTVEGRHDNMVQALVPVDNLLELSKDENVSYIRSPLSAHATRPEKGEEGGQQNFPYFVWIPAAAALAFIIYWRRAEN